MSSYRKFTFAISSADEFLVLFDCHYVSDSTQYFYHDYDAVKPKAKAKA